MILRRLCEAAPRILAETQTPKAYDWVAIPWIIRLGAEGEFLGIVGTQTPAEKRGTKRIAPTKKRTSGIAPILLADKAEYTLGFPVRDAKTADRNAAYVAQLSDCAQKTGEAPVTAVIRFLNTLRDGDPLARGVEWDRVEPGDTLAFQVNGVDPSTLPSVQSYWATVSGGEQSDSAPTTCLVCGGRKPIPGMLEVPIKRVPNGQSSGCALVSINSEAFESHGLERGKTSGVCAECGETFGKALNRLLEDATSNVRVGPVVYVFWTREAVAFDFGELLSHPTPESVQHLLRAYRRGHLPAATDETAFYATGLSANAARVVVRDWLETTLGHARENLARWFTRISIVDSNGSPIEPVGLFPLAACLYRDARKEMVEYVPNAIIRAALHGDLLPKCLLTQAVNRCRAEQGVTHPRAALIKAVLADTNAEDIEIMSELSPSETRPAYLCGRLLAVLEQIQKQAIQGINATVVDRFYGAASTAPATVFGTLLGDAQNHLGKLRKTKPGTGAALNGRIQEILEPLSGFPKTLKLEDQALFALGFYHQKANDRAQAIARKQQNAAAENGETDE